MTIPMQPLKDVFLRNIAGGGAMCTPERILFVGQAWPAGADATKFFTSVQAAISYAAANMVPTVGNPVLVLIAPGHYEESVTLAPWVYLKAWGQEGGGVFPSVSIGSAATTCSWISATGADLEQVQAEGILFGAPNVIIDTSGKTAGTAQVTFNGCVGQGLQVGGKAGLTHVVELDDSLFSAGAGASDLTLKLRNHSMIETSLDLGNAARLEADATCQLPVTTLADAVTATARGVLCTGDLTSASSGLCIFHGARVEGDVLNSAAGILGLNGGFVFGDVENSGAGLLDVSTSYALGDVENSGAGGLDAQNAVITGALTKSGAGNVIARGARVGGAVSNTLADPGSSINILKGSYGSLVGPGPIDRDQDGISFTTDVIAPGIAATMTIPLGPPFSNSVRVLCAAIAADRCSIVTCTPHHVIYAVAEFSVTIDTDLQLDIGSMIHWSATVPMYAGDVVGQEPCQLP